MTAVGDVIQSGQPIPDDVTGVEDSDGRAWVRTGRGHWHTDDGAIEACREDECYEDSTWKMRRRHPLTVTAVREQPDATKDDVPTWDVEEIFPTGPQQADVSPLLGLVKQYGNAREMRGWDAGRGNGYLQHDAEAAALLARIAALVPQQPVQARDIQGSLLWISNTGATVHHAAERPPGPWRPLLVGGERRPEPVQARDEDGNGWWIDGCGMAINLEVPPERCSWCNRPGSWRPLLVADAAPDGDRAPEAKCPGCGNLSHRGMSCIDMLKAQQALDILAQVMEALGVQRPEDVLPSMASIRTARDQWLKQAKYYRQQRDEAHAEVERLTSRVRHLEVELAGTQQMLDVATAPQEDDPLVLPLPAAPEGTVAVVGNTGVGEGIRAVPHPSIKNLWVYEQDIDKAEAPCFSLPHFLADYGPLRVELALPREPRTAAEIWAGLDSSIRDVLRDLGDEGRECAEALDREAGL